MQASQLSPTEVIICAGGLQGRNQFIFFRKSLTVPKVIPLPILIHCRTNPARTQNRALVASQSRTSTKTLKLRQTIRIEYKSTSKLCQSITIEYYVTRVVSQPQSSITSPESSRLEQKTLLGYRFFSDHSGLS